MNIKVKFRLNEFVKFSNGIEICIGDIKEIRVKENGNFYFIECSTNVYYEIKEDGITSLEK